MASSPVTAPRAAPAWRWGWLGAAAALLGGSGCQWSSAPRLLTVTGTEPPAVEAGERLEILGSAFPEGLRATVAFDGRVAVPAREGGRARFELPGLALSQNRVSVGLDDRAVARFCGDHEVSHVTFRGRLTVAFAPRSAGAPPIAGELGEARVDVGCPPPAAAARAAQAAQGQAWLSHVGLTLEDGTPLTVAAVAPGQAAARAGLLPGDVILSLGELAVREVGDLPTVAGRPHVPVEVQRGRLADPVRLTLDVRGFAGAAPEALPLAVGVVLVPALVLLLRALPGARWWSWLAARSRGAHPGGARSLTREVAVLIGVLVTAAIGTWFALGRALLEPDLDLALVAGLGATVSLAVGLLLGGAEAARGWSLRAGLRGAGRRALLELGTLAALAAAPLAAVSSRVGELVAAQGPWPWEWQLFRSPPLLIAALAVLASTVPGARAAAAAGPGGGRTGLLTRVTRDVLEAFVEGWRSAVLALLVALLFLGGWQTGAGGPPRLAGIMLLHAKAAGVFFLALAVRRALPTVGPREITALALRGVLPAAALGLGATVALGVGPYRLTATGQVLTGAVTFAVVSALAGLVLASALRRPSGAAHGVNPWL